MHKASGSGKGPDGNNANGEKNGQGPANGVPRRKHGSERTLRGMGDIPQHEDRMGTQTPKQPDSQPAPDSSEEDVSLFKPPGSQRTYVGLSPRHPPQEEAKAPEPDYPSTAPLPEQEAQKPGPEQDFEHASTWPAVPLAQQEDLQQGAIEAGAYVSGTEAEGILDMAEEVSDLEPDYDKVQKLEARGYTDIKIIGEGRMGQVYRATDPQLDRQVAIKVMSSAIPKKEGRARFMQEAKAAAGISHPNIVVIHDLRPLTDKANERDFYIVMEHLDGASLDDILKKGLMDCERARDIFKQVCSALTAAHNKGVIHRDIKPDNIFITKTEDGKDRVKLLDFGVAKVQSAKRKFETQKGRIVGTPAYMSPEQVKGEELDQRTDIYSLGAVMYHAVVGEDPFHDATSLETLCVQILALAPKPPRERNPGANIPEDFERIIMRCLAKNRDERFTNARELRDALKSARGQSGIPPAPASEPFQEGSKEAGYRTHAANGETHVGKGTGLDMVGPSEDPDRERLRRKNRRLFWGLAFGMGVAGIAGIGGSLALMDDKQDQPAAQAKEADAGKPPLEEPSATPQPTASKTVEPEDEVNEYTMTFRLNTDNVTVLVGDDEVCEPSKSKECSKTLPKGEEKVTFTFKKRGYKETTLEVVPDSNQGFDVELKPIPQRYTAPTSTKTNGRIFIPPSD